MSHSNNTKFTLLLYDLRKKFASSTFSFTFEYLYTGFSSECMNILHLNTNSEQPKIVFCICSQILKDRGKNEQIKEHDLKLKGVSKIS